MSWTRNHVANFRVSSSCMVSNACRMNVRHLALPEFQWGSRVLGRSSGGTTMMVFMPPDDSEDAAADGFADAGYHPASPMGGMGSPCLGGMGPPWLWLGPSTVEFNASCRENEESWPRCALGQNSARNGHCKQDIVCVLWTWKTQVYMHARSMVKPRCASHMQCHSIRHERRAQNAADTVVNILRTTNILYIRLGFIIGMCGRCKCWALLG